MSQKPRHGAAVQRGLIALNQALGDDRVGAYLVSDARRLGVQPSDMHAVIQYLSSLAEWKSRLPGEGVDAGNGVTRDS